VGRIFFIFHGIVFFIFVKKTQFSLFFMRECSDSRYQINFGGKEQEEEKLYGFC
jgi:hypothetical protein